MLEQLSLKIGGQQGEGIETCGDTFATAMNRLGYYIYSYRHFSSRITGGHSNDNVRVSTRYTGTKSDQIDILVAFDQESIDVNVQELRAGGVLLADSKFNPIVPDEMNIRFFPVPFTKLAQDAGSAIMKNIVALGACSCVLDLQVGIFRDIFLEKFARKGQKIVDSNMEAIQKGYEYLKAMDGSLPDFKLKPAHRDRHSLMTGNDALGMGSLAAGVRVMPAYPITPASDVMEYLMKKLPEIGGHVIQTEDEIAAITMMIGANYAGSRALTCTSGPGLSLMMEAIGLAGMTETPTVIIDTQRGGPSTGLPTKHEQSDLLAALFGTHGEIPRIVLAPATAEECFYVMIDAFNFAEYYQCPVIVLTDLALSLAKQTVEPFDFDKIHINRGKLAAEEQLVHTQSGNSFKRYEYTEDSISPRVFPGQKGGVHHVDGVEHNEFGRPFEGSDNRIRMMDKRMTKLNKFDFSNAITYSGAEYPDLLIVGIGSTIGAIDETMARLALEGHKIGHAHIRVLAPFPTLQLQHYINLSNKVLVIENNATAQLNNLMKFFGVQGTFESQLKYNGEPYLSKEVYSCCKELL